MPTVTGTNDIGVFNGKELKIGLVNGNNVVSGTYAFTKVN